MVGSGRSTITYGKNDKACKVDMELSNNFEEDKDETEGEESGENVDFGNAGLPLEVLDPRILAELPVNGVVVMVCFVQEWMGVT